MQITKTMLLNMSDEERTEVWVKLRRGDRNVIAAALRERGIDDGRTGYVTRIANCLANEGFVSLEDAQRAFLVGELDLTEIPNFGTKCAMLLSALFMGRTSGPVEPTANTVRYKRLMSAKRSADRLATSLDAIDAGLASEARALSASIQRSAA